MTPSLSDIKKSLETQDRQELLAICLRLAKFKKENKELLGFLLFEADAVEEYVQKVKTESDELFNGINMSSIYFIKKSIRKIVRTLHKYIRFSASKQVEAELLIYFCNSLVTHSIPLNKSRQLMNIHNAQVKKIEEALSSLHPDLQYDLRREINF